MTSEETNVEDITRAEAVERLATLSDRQREVLALRCQGLQYQFMSYKEIAEQLGITETTVKTHMVAIYQKLGLDSLQHSRRIKVLVETFCPLLSEGKPPLPDPDEADSL